jgi:purine-binding chemotaxis protein CheW
MKQVRDLTEVNAELQEKKAAVDTVDFKMVTFSLGGKDYGVDIMSVKEIAKADKFTFVPNAPSFVRGVYNLRGEIIPIIDLRTFFHLPLSGNDGLENMLILHIEDHIYGTIVDRIDKVVGINTETIQPPHPIFGDINIKYIQGVVEKNGDLYVILDVIRIFSQKQPQEQSGGVEEKSGGGRYQAVAAIDESAAAPVPHGPSSEELAFVKDQLAALKQFFVGPLNEEWIALRFEEWRQMRRGADVQLKNPSDADAFVEPFYSPFTGAFWSDEYAYALKALLPALSSNNIQVWNPGCGKGYETFSLACILKLRYPDARIKIWANDNDIMSIANAPNMTFERNDVPEYCRTFLSQARSGYMFNAHIKDSIVFEYHDVTNENTIPNIDIVLCRDLLSFLPVQKQDSLVKDFSEKLKNKGVVILGEHEKLSDPWRFIGQDHITMFAK